MSNNPVNVEELGSGIGTKRAAAAIEFRDAVERRGAKTVGKHMEKIIDDCQVAWAASTNVTATADIAARKVNARGAKLVIAVGFTTGLVATRDFVAADLSGYKYIGFWIKSDIQVAANALQLVLDESAACASPDETLNIPLLPAGVWRYIRVAVTGAETTRDAIISIGINASNDPGAATLFIDDIRAGNEYLGVADEMQDKNAYAQYDPVHIIDQGKAEVGLAGTALSGQYLEPVGNGKFAVSSNGVAGQEGMKTINSRIMAVEDQATENGTVPARMV
ncbi:MAG: hypothetical protein OIN87_00350 [Candidatus Methanoperedens sp.]|nr:hypothetical protein [Candidatus Methanoperedens sp.]